MNATIRAFFKKEMAQVVRDKRMRMLLFVMPAVQMALFGLALSNEVRNIKLVVVSQPGDTLAREVRERAFASGWFVPGRAEESDLTDALRSGRANAILIAPPEGLTDAVARKDGRVQLLVDASNAVRARAIESYVRAVLDRVAPTRTSGGFRLDVRVLYNPSMRTAVFLVPGVMCLILCILTIILTSMSLAREKEMGTFEMLISAPVTIREILLGKTIPYIVLGLVDVPIVLGVAILGFGVPMRGSIAALVLASIVFVAAAVATGTLISTFAQSQQQAMMGGFLFLFPAIQLSSIIYPLDNIPRVIAWVPYLNPLYYYAVLLRNIMLKGGDPFVVWTNLGAMAALGAAAVAYSAHRFRRTLN